jgi:hypothetical protein
LTRGPAPASFGRRRARRGRIRLLLRIIASAGFDSFWYWVLHAVVWTLVCARTLGVPHDMLLRARHDATAAERVEILARLSAERVAGIADAAGLAIAAAAGFVLAALAALGFLSGLAGAQAAFVLLLPVALIAASKLRLALFLRGRRLPRPRLVLMLSRRRFWHQTIAVAAVLAAVALAWTLHPPRPI